MFEAAKNTIQKLQANPFVHILQETCLLSSTPFKMISLRWKQEAGNQLSDWSLHSTGIMQRRPIHNNAPSSYIQWPIDSIESRTSGRRRPTLWKLKSRTVLTECKPSTQSFSRLALAAAIALWDRFVASNAQFSSFICKQRYVKCRLKHHTIKVIYKTTCIQHYCPAYKTEIQTIYSSTSILAAK